MRDVTRILYLVIALAFASACGGPQPDSAAGTTPVAADSLYAGGVIWTGVPGAADASVLAVRDGRIIYVGDGQDVEFDVDPARRIDLGGRFLMPGFIDNHVHFFWGGAALASVDLRDAATPDEFSARIADYAATLPEGRWVQSGNWDHQLWGGELPRKEWIDEGTGDTPVFVMRLDGHMGLANSAALALAGITAATESPAGGEIVRDDSGEPTGILKDNAMGLINDVIPPPSETEMLELFELAQDHALSLGLTQVHAMTGSPSERSHLDYFRLARERGLMKLRIHAYMPLAHWAWMTELVAREGHGDDRLRWGGLKGFVDGSLGSGTACFREPYLNDPSNRGFPLTEPDQLRALLENADAAGRRLAIHAIGDRAIDRLVDDMREIAGDKVADRRFRIEHYQHPTRSAIEATADAGIIASAQPYHAIDDGRWLEGHIGAERARTTYAFRSILDTGGILTFGSDWPVAPLSPLKGVYAAVTRRTIDDAYPDGWQPQEKITVEQALAAYTRNNAYAVFEEAEGGTLEIGKRADLVVLGADPRRIAPERIPELSVVETVINGERVYVASDSAP